ncbi:hypothetical protein ACFQ0M_48310 [Kitasatospora aburaviensis]
MTPANEIKPGAVIDYHEGGRMLVATSDTVSNRWFGRRHFLHGVVLTLPASGAGPWRIGGPADRTTTPAPRSSCMSSATTPTGAPAPPTSDAVPPDRGDHCARLAPNAARRLRREHPERAVPDGSPARPVPAEADACGTEALFGEPTAPAAPAAHQSQPPAVHRPRPVLIPP